MHNKHIREMPQVDAAKLYARIGTRWYATMGFKVDAVLHIWEHITGNGPLNNAGVTLCGRTLLPTGKGDYENIVTQRHCPVCSKKLALLDQSAHLLDNDREGVDQ